MSKLCTAEEAVNHVNSNQRVFVHGGAATPLALVNALVGEASRLRDVELIHLHTSGDAAYAKPEYARRLALLPALLYRYWFRVETRDIARVPQGRVLLIGNHAGNTFAYDGTMLAMAMLPPRG